MEKQPKLKNKILKILPKAAAAVTVTFQNLPFSPNRDHKRPKKATRWFKSQGNKGFSGPMVSMIPAEARRKPKDGGIDSHQEPTSPKVSCMGQIKHKKKKIKKAKVDKSVSLPKDMKPLTTASAPSTPREVKKHPSTFRRIFHAAKPAVRKSGASAPSHDKKEADIADRAPRLSQMKQFASGRDALANFDWKAQVAPEELDQRDYYSDEDRVDSDAEEEEDFAIPFSAPILVGGAANGGGVPLQPRKEINIWKRRTMAPPRPLQLNPVHTAN